jgi:hypothetical protein
VPLEIRELVIKATIGNDSEGTSGTSDNAAPADAKEAYVNLVVEKVLEILKENTER